MRPAYLLGLGEVPDRQEAQRAAREELAKHAYQEARPSWLERLVRWVVSRLQELLDRAGHHLPGGGWGLLVLTLVLAALVVALVVRVRPAAGRTRSRQVFGATSGATAAEHRTRSAAAAARGDLAEAVAERFRAVVRELEERGVLEPRPGRTADEVARDAGAVVVALRVPLLESARLFDAVRYGGKPAGTGDYQQLVAVDAQVGAARLVPA